MHHMLDRMVQMNHAHGQHRVMMLELQHLLRTRKRAVRQQLQLLQMRLLRRRRRLQPEDMARARWLRLRRGRCSKGGRRESIRHRQAIVSLLPGQ